MIQHIYINHYLNLRSNSSKFQNFKVRVSEHRRATNKGKKQHSALAEHACNKGHQPLWEERTNLAQVPHLGMRLSREALEIRINDTSTLNRNDGKKISGMWKSLFSNSQS